MLTGYVKSALRMDGKGVNPWDNLVFTGLPAEDLLLVKRTFRAIHDSNDKEESEIADMNVMNTKMGGLGFEDRMDAIRFRPPFRRMASGIHSFGH